MYHVDSLGHYEAQLAVQAIQEELVRRGKQAVIAVSDAHGELITLLRLDGAPLPSITIASNKAFTAARERKPTREIGQSSRAAATGFDIAYFGDNRFVGWGGGLPVISNGLTLGAVAVSGLSEQEDAELAQIGINAIPL
jgi:glc operon protein GlcG